MGEILLLKFFLKTNFKWGIYSPIRNLPVGSWKGPNCPSGRPANGHIFYRWAQRSIPGRPSLDPERNGSLVGRPPGRPSWYKEQSSLPVDRVSRPGPFPDSRGSLAVDRSGRPVQQPGCVHVLCTSVDRPGRPPTATVDRSGRSAVSESSQIRDWKLEFLLSIKSHKNT